MEQYYVIIDKLSCLLARTNLLGRALTGIHLA